MTPEIGPHANRVFATASAINRCGRDMAVVVGYELAVLAQAETTPMALVALDCHQPNPRRCASGPTPVPVFVGWVGAMDVEWQGVSRCGLNGVGMPL